MLKDELAEVFGKHEGILWGSCDISYSQYSEEYKNAIVFAVPHSTMMRLETYKEEMFENLILETVPQIDCIMKELVKLLDLNNINYYIPPVAQNPGTYTAPFSFKYAAVRAGIGWIGKNDVLITEQYGPRVRLAAILINEKLPEHEVVIENKCISGCQICVDACPYHMLKNELWNIKSQRSEIVDYCGCDQKRSLFIPIKGRKNSCGICMVSCPYGLQSLK